MIHPHITSLLADLDAIKRDCAEPNWDGQCAEAVSSKTIERARQFLEGFRPIEGTEVSPYGNGILFDFVRDSDGSRGALLIEEEGSFTFVWTEKAQKT